MPSGVYKRKLPVWNKGKKLSESHIKKLSDAKIGKKPWNAGKPSPWTSTRNKLVNPTKRGSTAYHWKGGTYGTERHRDMSRLEYKKWRSDIFERDNWTCQTCQARGVYLEAHHIKSWAKFPDLRYVLENGVTLCKPCHDLITFKKNK